MREVELLHQKLEALIKIYTLPEVLNTIANLSNEQRKLDQLYSEQWRAVIIKLEEATEASLELANQHVKKEKFWK